MSVKNSIGIEKMKKKIEKMRNVEKKVPDLVDDDA